MFSYRKKRMSSVNVNANGGFYMNGQGFDDAKYATLISRYQSIMDQEGECSIRKLALDMQVSRETARKAVILSNEGPYLSKSRGRPKGGIGSSFDMTADHHMFIYRLYLELPSRPLEDYCLLFYQATGISVSNMFISRWFNSIGPFKGRMRLTSLFPPKNHSPKNFLLFNEYLDFIERIDDQRRLVFTDEKPMKATMSYGKVRRDPMTGEVPPHIAKEANSTKRYNIFAAISVKNVQKPVEAVVLDLIGDSIVFQHFVLWLLDIGFLQPGDIFVVDNCTIHMQGVNEFLVDALWYNHNVAMVPLPPYCPELNPTELAFNTMQTRITAKRSRAKAKITDDFSDAIQDEFDCMSIIDTEGFFRHCGYKV